MNFEGEFLDSLLDSAPVHYRWKWILYNLMLVSQSGWPHPVFPLSARALPGWLQYQVARVVRVLGVGRPSFFVKDFPLRRVEHRRREEDVSRKGPLDQGEVDGRLEGQECLIHLAAADDQRFRTAGCLRQRERLRAVAGDQATL